MSVAFISAHPPYLPFPQELSDDIISQLQSDIPSLKRCSLVCRSWLSSSRRQLFRRLILTPQNTLSFISFLRAIPLSTIPFHVKQIQIRHIHSGSGEIGLNILIPFASSLTSLQLYAVAFDSFVEFLDVICGIAYLQFLDLDHVVWGSKEYTRKPTVSQWVLPPYVDRLRLKHSPLREIMLWLTSHKIVPLVSHLDIGPIEEQDTLYAGSYMFHIGPFLTHLALSFGYGEKGHVCGLDFMEKLRTRSNRPHYKRPIRPTMGDRFWEVFGVDPCINMAAFSNLHSIRIDNFLNNAAPHQSTALFWAPRALASFRSRNLSHIVLGLTLSRVGELDKHNINWEFLDEVFGSEYYATLHSVQFKIKGRVNAEGLASLISSRLPLTASRGLLRFQSY